MAAEEDASISLLRRLRAGATVNYVHRVDVCSAAPEDLVSNLQPAPGTDGMVWYFYCPKKFKNAQGKACGHRHRAISGGDTCWHAEARPKQVHGGCTACNLSYGRKDGRSFSRLGWCMVEYDDDDNSQPDVLCKVYRSPRAPPAPKTQPSSGSKRKAAAGEHLETTRPAKLSSHDQQQQPHMEILGGEEEQPSAEQLIEFDIEGFLRDGDAEMLDELLPDADQETAAAAAGMPPPALPLSDADLFDGLEDSFLLGLVQEEETVQMQQPCPEPTAMACQRQQSQWMMMHSLLQGPPLQLPYMMC